MNDTEIAAVAQTYAHADLAVFPLWWPINGACACPAGATCPSPAKHPMVRRGVDQATTDLDFITGFWQRYPHANIGLAAGTNQLAILDIDPRHDGDNSYGRLCAWMDKMGQPMPDTLWQHTGSGGRHVVFNAPADGIKGAANTFGADMPGLDTRGRGGYIVAAPSAHVSGGTYRWESFLADIADWPPLLHGLMNPARPPADPFDSARANTTGARYGQAALNNEIDNVRNAAEGTRNAVLNEAAFALGQLVEAGALGENTVTSELHGAAISVGLHDAESRKTIASGIAGGKAKPRT